MLTQVYPSVIWPFPSALGLVEAWRKSLTEAQQEIVAIVTDKAQFDQKVRDFTVEEFHEKLKLLGIASQSAGPLIKVFFVGSLKDDTEEWVKMERIAGEESNRIAQDFYIHNILMIHCPKGQEEQLITGLPAWEHIPWVINQRNNLKFLSSPVDMARRVGELLEVLILAEVPSNPNAVGMFLNQDRMPGKARLVGYTSVDFQGVHDSIRTSVGDRLLQRILRQALGDPPDGELLHRWRQKVGEFVNGQCSSTELEETIFGRSGFASWHPSTLAAYGYIWSAALSEQLQSEWSYRSTTVHSQESLPASENWWRRLIRWIKRLFGFGRGKPSDVTIRIDEMQIETLRERLIWVSEFTTYLHEKSEHQVVGTPGEESHELDEIQARLTDGLHRMLKNRTGFESWRDSIQQQLEKYIQNKYSSLLESYADRSDEVQQFLKNLEKKTLLRWSGILAGGQQIQLASLVSSMDLDSIIKKYYGLFICLEMFGPSSDLLVAASEPVDLNALVF